MTAKKKKQTKSFQTPFQVRTLPNTTDSDDDKNPLLLENLKQNTVDLDHFRPPLTHHDFFGLTDTWFQTGNAALFAAYGLMYGLHFINESMIPKLALNVLVCGWNYFDFVGRMFIHIYNIVEIVRGHREKKNKIALEIADMTASSVLVTGTTLSLLANVHVLTGTLAVACAPLASLTPAFCSIVLGFIEYSKCYKEAQKLKLPILLRDRLKKYKRSKRKLESRKKLSETHRKELEEERGAMLEQAFAIARVAYAKKEIDKDGLSALLEQLELNLDVSIVTQQPNLDRLTRSPQQRDRDMVNFALSKQRETVRSHGFNGSFWLLVGTGCALASVATFFCPILLAPAIAVIAMAITIKTMELLEIDKRIHNRCCDEKNQKTIEFDNLVINYLAHRQKAKAIRREYKERDDNTLELVPAVDHNGKTISKGARVKMRMAYELSTVRNAKLGALEEQFYLDFLKLSWWQRRKILNRAMDKKVEIEIVAKSKLAIGMTQADKDYYVAQTCRKEYSLFGKPKKPSVNTNALAKEAAARRATLLKKVQATHVQTGETVVTEGFGYF